MKSKVTKVFLGSLVLTIALCLMGEYSSSDRAWAQTTQTITLISGGNGGSQDPANQFTLDGGVTWQDAYIIRPHSLYHIIPGTQYIAGGICLSHAAIRYRTSFVLPSGFSKPSLTVHIHADNVATIFLNGFQMGQQTWAETRANFSDPPESFAVTDPSLFQAGANLLEFDIYNFNCPTGFDYKAIVSFTSVLQMEIDIKPGSDPNCFNINGHGVIPVAILGSSELDVNDINLESISFAGLEVRVRGNRGPLCSFEYVNDDEFLDLVCHFEDNPDYWSPGDGVADLIGELRDGTSFKGTDSICVIP